MLNRLFSRFGTDEIFFKDYQQFLEEYLELGQMTQVLPDKFEPNLINYLTHHGVPHHSGVTSKLRVVFNGSNKSSNGVSLNDILHTGAKLQIELFDVLLGFRRFRYVFATDIEKMFRQILVHPDDWHFQRILWRDCLGNNIAYNLTTVTYGLVCAPFLALRTLKQLIEDEGKNFPLAVPVLLKGRYVDDIFGGGDSIENVQQIAHQVKELCMAGGFPLRKWVCNNAAVLNKIPNDHRLPMTSLKLDQPTSISTLGLFRRPNEDTFHISLGPISLTSPTKRTISSQIARLFDPLGFLAPVIIKAKILLQELWTVGVGCDEPIPETMSLKWIKFVRELHELQDLHIPRWIGTICNSIVQIHGFSDASQVAIAAAVYLRVSEGDQIKTSLVCSKKKVTPLKRLTIPRLELTAAALLTRLTSLTCKTLELTNTPIYLWTDSSIAHTWINNHPSRWKEYVQNRVCLIQKTLPHAHWKLVPGHDNPADFASRGLTPFELSNHDIWWNGPSWLKQDSTRWPLCEDSGTF